MRRGLWRWKGAGMGGLMNLLMRINLKGWKLSSMIFKLTNMIITARDKDMTIADKDNKMDTIGKIVPKVMDITSKVSKAKRTNRHRNKITS